MSKKDKRIRMCPNEDCVRHQEKYKYKSADQFCTLCGSPLIFVCAKCFCEIEDLPDMRRFCMDCKPEKAKDGTKTPKPEKAKDGTKTPKPAKEKKRKSSNAVGDAAAKGVDKIKEKAPQIKEEAKKIAQNPNAQRLALEVAEIAKDGIRNRKIRRAAGILIRAAKKD